MNHRSTRAILAMLMVFAGCDRKAATAAAPPPSAAASATQAPAIVPPLVAEFRRAALAGDKTRLQQLQHEVAAGGNSSIGQIASILDDKQAAVRRAVADCLVATGSHAAIRLLVSNSLHHLADPNGVMGYGEGYFNLREIGPRAIPFLIDSFDVHNPSNDKLVEVVSEMREATAEPLLLAALKDPDRKVAQHAAIGLGSIKAPSALGRLTSLLGDPRPEMRFGAIKGLRELGDASAVPALLEVLKRPDQVADYLKDNAELRLTGPMTLHGAAAEAIDSITGRRFKGDVAAIRAWLAKKGSANRQSTSQKQ